jgi:hypothetical protein
MGGNNSSNSGEKKLTRAINPLGDGRIHQNCDDLGMVYGIGLPTLMGFGLCIATPKIGKW